MTHEPECPCWSGTPCLVDCGGCPDCTCTALRAAYRRGYNDHARAQQHWQDTHGAYTQHGEGTNP